MSATALITCYNVGKVTILSGANENWTKRITNQCENENLENVPRVMKQRPKLRFVEIIKLICNEFTGECARGNIEIPGQIQNGSFSPSRFTVRNCKDKVRYVRYIYYAYIHT